MHQRIVGKARIPIIKMVTYIFRGANVLHRAVCNISVDQFRKCVLFLMLVEIEFALSDFSFNIGSPIFGFLFAIKMVADGRIALDADDGTPMTGPVLVFKLLN
jgi:hypothetical protein